MRYAEGTPEVYVYNDESDHLHTPEGKFGRWLRYHYTRQVQTEVVTHTEPAEISVGGDFALDVDWVMNDKSSVIVGGTLTGTIGELHNLSGIGKQIISDSGSVSSFWRDYKKGRDGTGHHRTSYHPPPQQLQIPLQMGSWTEHAAAGLHRPAATLPALDTRSLPEVATSTLPTLDTSSPPALATNTPASLDVIRSLPSPRYTGYSSLQRNASPQASYLVETDPRFTQRRAWLSSDYMQRHLQAHDPTATLKRLGDGFYEQRLIREQIAQLTGRRFLQGYASDEAQFQALMDNGLSAAQSLKLRPGVALSPAQIAQLNSHIVWLVEDTITLPDGQRRPALVPRVYAKADNTSVNGIGTLFSANQMNLNLSGTLTNAGNIVGWNTLEVGAQQINNLGGRFSADQMAMLAREDINMSSHQFSSQFQH